MNPSKNTEFLQDEEYQLTFLLDAPPLRTEPGRSPVGAEVAEHVLHLPPADERP
jgi:hypothetical protein